jgi:uncharacterized membrane protein YqjE
MSKTFWIAIIIVALIGIGLSLFNYLTVSPQEAGDSWGFAYLGSIVILMFTAAVIFVLAMIGALWKLKTVSKDPSATSTSRLVPITIILILVAFLVYYFLKPL